MTDMHLQNFRNLCRDWRRHRNLSQLDLALEADISQRHISYLETGRSKPSRDMVIRLAEALDIPLRERNLLLESAGFTAEYSESALDDPLMAPIMQAVDKMLDHHDPMPAIVVDRMWNICRMNKAATAMLALFSALPVMQLATDDQGRVNLAMLSVHPEGVRRFVTNWELSGPLFLRRLRREALAARDEVQQKWFAELIDLARDGAPQQADIDGLVPVLPLEMEIAGAKLSLFSVISTFGTPQDITTDELRVECSYAMNEDTKAFFQKLAVATS